MRPGERLKCLYIVHLPRDDAIKALATATESFSPGVAIYSMHLPNSSICYSFGFYESQKKHMLPPQLLLVAYSQQLLIIFPCRV